MGTRVSLSVTVLMANANIPLRSPHQAPHLSNLPKRRSELQPHMEPILFSAGQDEGKRRIFYFC